MIPWFARIQTSLLVGEGLLAVWVLVWLFYRLEKILPWNG